MVAPSWDATYPRDSPKTGGTLVGVGWLLMLGLDRATRANKGFPVFVCKVASEKINRKQRRLLAFKKKMDTF